MLCSGGGGNKIEPDPKQRDLGWVRGGRRSDLNEAAVTHSKRLGVAVRVEYCFVVRLLHLPQHRDDTGHQLPLQDEVT